MSEADHDEQRQEPLGGSRESDRTDEPTVAEPNDQSEQHYGKAETTSVGDPEPSGKEPSKGEMADAAGESYNQPDEGEMPD